MKRDVPFHFEVPAVFFEKASATPGQRRRVGGIISMEVPDQQGELVLQKGLVFDSFLKNGWFNDNHSKKTTDVLGYPVAIETFEKGQQLPNGMTAPAACTWVEGYLLEGWPPADEIWALGKALQSTGRRLGYSVEGKITRRVGPRTIFKKGDNGSGEWVGNTIAQAVVRNVAITNCPVNDQSSMEVLAKSLMAASLDDDASLEDRVAQIEKALTAGHAYPTPHDGTVSGQGAGRVLTPDSAEEDGELHEEIYLGDEEAEEIVKSRYPRATSAQLKRIVALIRTMKVQGQLTGASR